MDDEPKIYGRRWRVLRTLGRGGQGVVYEVDDVTAGSTRANAVNDIGEALDKFGGVRHNREERAKASELVAQALEKLARADSLPRAALKELLPMDEAINAKTATARMKTELEALKTVKHPALIRLLDEHLEDRWFVTEYFKGGPFGKQITRYRGRVLEALKAFRPVVEATAALHEKSFIHRDIKPDNVFIGDNDQLVLGDCGLAIKLENQDRLTLTYENVGTRDYQPPWSYGVRLEDVKPNFDVFSLAKVLWAMISGRPKFPLEDFDIDPHDLRSQFPDDPAVQFVHRIFKRCIVRREPQCSIPDASALLAEVDRAIHAISAGAQVPSTATGRMRCRFCAIGTYHEADKFQVSGNLAAESERHYFTCNHCGHLESFLYLSNTTPPAWNE